jgi:7-cyano-7-deazaguanine synthase
MHVAEHEWHRDINVLWRSASRRTLVLFSGGLDSVTLAYKIASEAALEYLLSFDYDQNHKAELSHARRCATRLGVPHAVIDLRDVGRNLAGSALTGGAPVPDGHYTEQSMRGTIVPMRNATFACIACGIAAENSIGVVAAAIHGGDHVIYPDCRPAFVEAFGFMQRLALDGIAKISFEAPFLGWRKSDIVRLGARLGVPFAETWSCYKGLDRHCGRCGTCVARREAFHIAGVQDPTPYVDPHYWLEALRGRMA